MVDVITHDRRANELWTDAVFFIRDSHRFIDVYNSTYNHLGIKIEKF